MNLVATTLSDTIQRVALQGRLDAAGAAEIETRFTGTISAGGKNVVLDLGGVEFLGSLGIRLIIANARVLQRRGMQLLIIGAQAQPLDVFETVDLGSLVPILATEAEALARLAGQPDQA